MFAEKQFIRWHLVNDHVERPDRFYDLHERYGRVDPLAEVNLAPPKWAQVTVIYNESGTGDDLDLTGGESSSSDSETGSLTPTGSRVQKMKINLNKSVKEFKQQLR